MVSRKRVEIILNHKEADRIPIDVGSTEVTSINIHAYKTLRQYWQMEEKEIYTANIVQQLASPHEDFLEKIGCDFRPIVANPCLLYTSPSPRDLSTSRMPSSA